MICKNCGAEIDDALLLCPYCNTENEKVAAKEHRDEVDFILEQSEELKTRPEQIAKKVNHKISRIACYIVAGFVVLLFVVFVVSRIIGDPSIKKLEKKVAKLESYYAVGDYDGMSECLDGMEDTFTEQFKKYRNVWRVYHWLDSQEGSYGLIKERRGTKFQETDFIRRTLATSRDLLYEIEQAEKAGFRYGEAEGMLYVREEIYRMMKDATGITEEEIERYFKNLPEEEDAWPDLGELAEILVTR